MYQLFVPNECDLISSLIPNSLGKVCCSVVGIVPYHSDFPLLYHGTSLCINQTALHSMIGVFMYQLDCPILNDCPLYVFIGLPCILWLLIFTYQSNFPPFYGWPLYVPIQLPPILWLYITFLSIKSIGPFTYQLDCPAFHGGTYLHINSTVLRFMVSIFMHQLD